MRDFFRPWNTLHFAILYVLIFAVQISLYIIARKKQQDRYWISLVILQILSVLLVIFGNDGGGWLLSIPNNIISGAVAVPIYGIFFIITLSERSNAEEMARTELWRFFYKGILVALLISLVVYWFRGIWRGIW